MSARPTPIGAYRHAHRRMPSLPARARDLCEALVPARTSASYLTNSSALPAGIVYGSPARHVLCLDDVQQGHRGDPAAHFFLLYVCFTLATRKAACRAASY